MESAKRIRFIERVRCTLYWVVVRDRRYKLVRQVNIWHAKLMKRAVSSGAKYMFSYTTANTTVATALCFKSRSRCSGRHHINKACASSNRTNSIIWHQAAALTNKASLCVRDVRCNLGASNIGFGRTSRGNAAHAPIHALCSGYASAGSRNARNEGNGKKMRRQHSRCSRVQRTTYGFGKLKARTNGATFYST